MRVWLAVGVLVAMLGACGKESGPSVSVIDRGGIRFVESYEPAWRDSATWSVGGPILELNSTGDGPTHEFYRVTDAIRLSDGSIVVANDGTSEVRFYSPNGQFHATAGRSGDGPGEFRRIRTLSRMRGDSVAVYDPLLTRLTILGPDGEYGRDISLLGHTRYARSLRAYDDSTFLGLTFSMPDRRPGRYRVPYSVVRLGVDGEVMDTLAVIPGVEGFQTSRVDSPVPFGKQGHLTTLGAEFVIGPADSLAFERYSRPGVQSQFVSVPGYDLAIPQEQRDSTRWNLLNRADGRPHPASIQEAVESVPIPEHKPGYRRLLLDAGGYVWAGRYKQRQLTRQSEEWELFAPSGEWLGSVATPVAFTVLRIGTNEILGVQYDEFDVEHVQLIELVRND